MPQGDPATAIAWAVLLAAGQSQRFGGPNKLLADVGGSAMVARVAARALASRAAGVIVVTGHEAREVAAALAGAAVRIVENPDYREGLSSSLRTGLCAVPPGADGALVCLADMPGLTTQALDRLLAAFQETGGAQIVYTEHSNGEPGNPVVWPRRYFPELTALSGDRGGKPALWSHRGDAIGVAAGESGECEDIDTQAELAAWKARQAQGGT